MQTIIFYLGHNFRVLCKKCNKFDVEVRFEIKGPAHIIVECKSCAMKEAEDKFHVNGRRDRDELGSA
jgi:RNase P subunit RPR2